MMSKDKVYKILENKFEEFHPERNSNWDSFKNRLNHVWQVESGKRKLVVYFVATLIVLFSSVVTYLTLNPKSIPENNLVSQHVNIITEKSEKEIIDIQPQNKVEDNSLTKQPETEVNNYVKTDEVNDTEKKHREITQKRLRYQVKLKKKLDYFILNPITSNLTAGVLFDEQENIYERSKVVSQPKYNGKWAFRFSFEPGLTLWNESSVKGHEKYFHEDYETIKKNSESPGFGFSIGVDAIYKLNPHFNILSGLSYTQLSKGLDYNFSNFKIPVINGETREIMGYIIDSTVENTFKTTNNHYNYLKIPVILESFVPVWSKYELSLKLGGAIYYSLSSDNYELKYSDLTFQENDKSDYKTFNTGLIFGIGLWNRSNRYFCYGIEPTYQMFLNSVSKDEKLEIKPYAFGIKTSLEINF